MSEFDFKKAERRQSKARIAIAGPSGSGKTMTALLIARGLVGPEGRIAVIDTEKDSASLYADVTDFDVLNLTPPFQPMRYIKAIEAAEERGYDAIIVDSISHEWNGTGGCQQMVDEALRRMKTTNTMMGWKEVTPLHNQFLDKLVRADAHLIATIRSKTAYEIDKDDKGRTTVKKLGLAPVQREGVEYEFTVFADLELDHSLRVTKSRMRALQDRTIFQPDEALGRKIAAWLGTAEAEEPTMLEALLDDFKEADVLAAASTIAQREVTLAELHDAPTWAIEQLDKELRVSQEAPTPENGSDGTEDSAASVKASTRADVSQPAESEGEGSADRPEPSPDDPAQEFARIAAKAKDELRIFKKDARKLLIQAAGKDVDYDAEGPTLPIDVLHAWERDLERLAEKRAEENQIAEQAKLGASA